MSLGVWKILIFKKKTSGDVYFYSSPNPVHGKDIDEKMYDKLSAKMKKAVVAIERTKLPGNEGYKGDIWYVDSKGVIQWYDEVGMSDFYWGLKQIKDLGVVSDWEYDGKWSEGRQLKRRT